MYDLIEELQAKTKMLDVSIKKLRVKDIEYSEDTGKDYEDEIQKLTDKYVSQIDDLIAEKTKEIMTV